jgi:hypothetical protein
MNKMLHQGDTENTEVHGENRDNMNKETRKAGKRQRARKAIYRFQHR